MVYRLTEIYNRKLTPTLSIEEQERKAAYWARQAAETGLASAQRDLGFMYMNGRPGEKERRRPNVHKNETLDLEKDPKKAMTWLFYASQQKYPLIEEDNEPDYGTQVS